MDSEIETLVESTEEIELDPVCGEVLDLDIASEHDLVLEFEGRAYAFCGLRCRSVFEHEPTRYATAGRAQP